MRERNRLASGIDAVLALEREVADTLELIELAEAESDTAMVADGMKALRGYADEAKKREIESLLSGEADANDCYMELNAGAGGTEAQDWAQMLMRTSRCTPASVFSQPYAFGPETCSVADLIPACSPSLSSINCTL